MTDPQFIAPPEPTPAAEPPVKRKRMKAERNAIRALQTEMDVNYTTALRAYESGKRASDEVR